MKKQGTIFIPNDDKNKITLSKIKIISIKVWTLLIWNKPIKIQLPKVIS